MYYLYSLVCDSEKQRKKKPNVVYIDLIYVLRIIKYIVYNVVQLVRSPRRQYSLVYYVEKKNGKHDDEYYMTEQSSN